MRRHFAATLVALAVLTAPVAAQEEDHLQRALEVEVTLSFYRTPLEDVLDALRSAAKLNVVAGPSVNAKALSVTAEAEGETVGRLLSRIESSLGLARTTWCDALVLHRPEDAPGPEPTEGLGHDGLTERLSVNFVRTPAPVALERLERRSGVAFVVPAEVEDLLIDRDVAVDLRLWSAQVRCILTHLTRDMGLTWRVDGDAVALAVDPRGRADDVEAEALPGVDVFGELDEQGPQADVSRLLAQLAEPRTREAAALRLRRVPRAAPQVAAFLRRTEDPDGAQAALRILAETGTAAEAETVAAVFADEDRSLEVRRAAAHVLGELKAESTIPALVDALDGDWLLLAEAARKALTAIGEPALGPLARAYRSEIGKGRDRRDGVVYRGLLVFGSTGGDTARDLLLEALARRGRQHVALRHHAAIGLGLMKDPTVVEPMIEAMRRETEFRVSKYITRSLGWILKAQGIEVDMPPRPDLWEDWWRRNRERVLEPKEEEDLYEPLEPDFGGLPQLDEDKD